MSKTTGVIAALLTGSLLTGCSSSTGSSGAPGASGKHTIRTSFYPLQYVTQRIAGDQETVSNLTPPGGEPHDLELSPKDVADVSSADLVVYLSDFQPGIDDAISSSGAKNVLDVRSAARLDRPGDPHFWLDPTRLADVGDAIAERMAKDDPGSAAQYTANAQALRKDLTALDASYTQRLSTCQARTLVTSHDAFGYLTSRYQLKTLSVAGINPHDEPNAKSVADVSSAMREQKLTAVFTEPLTPSDIALTVASETKAQVLSLDPLEGLTSADAKDDYLSIMRANLDSLAKGLNCQ